MINTKQWLQSHEILTEPKFAMHFLKSKSVNGLIKKGYFKLVHNKIYFVAKKSVEKRELHELYENNLNIGIFNILKTKIEDITYIRRSKALNLFRLGILVDV